MFKAIKEFFVGKPAPVVDAVAPGGAPYKVDAPWTLPEPVVEPIAPMPVGIEAVIATPVDIQNEQRHDTALTVVTAEVILTPISVATVTVESPAKVTRGPRAPKLEPVAAVKEKTPAKAKVPKLTVVKAEKPAKSKKV